MSLRIKWIETINEFPIFKDISDTVLYSNNHEITLPLALVELYSWNEEFIKENDISLEFIPRRFYRVTNHSFDLSEAIRDSDLIFLSFTAAEAHDAQKILKLCKKQNKVTVVGGVYPTLSPETIKLWNTVDFIVKGEGELAFRSIIRNFYDKTLQNQYTNIGLGMIITPQTPDLQKFPLLKYEDFIFDDLKDHMRSARYMLSRGCPHSCSFCSTSYLFGRSNRQREIKTIIEDFKNLYYLGFKKISLADDSVAINKVWLKNLLKEIAKNNIGYSLKIRVRADELDRELVSMMNDANVKIIQFGVENISQKILDNYKKNLSIKNIEKAFNLILNSNHLLANPLFMYNSVGETWGDFLANNQFIRDIGNNSKVITYISFTTPYPGTELFNGINSHGRLITKDLRFYNNKFPVFIPSEMLLNSLDDTLNRIVEEYKLTSKIVNVHHKTQSPISQVFFKHLNVKINGNRS